MNNKILRYAIRGSVKDAKKFGIDFYLNSRDYNIVTISMRTSADILGSRLHLKHIYNSNQWAKSIELKEQKM